MKKVFSILAIVVSSSLAIALWMCWQSGKLFVRVSEAEINHNGFVSAKSCIYESKSDYMIFLENNESHFPVYVVEKQGKFVGIIAGEDRSIFSEPMKTKGFVLCFDCAAYLGGPEKFNFSARVTATSGEINFKVYGDNVIVKFY